MPASLKVLFIGNSFTARNNLPGLVALLANAGGKHLEHQLISVGGASLRTHWNKGAAVQEIARGGYDVVVLQEQSTLPIKNAARMHENVRLFDASIKAGGARTALYLTWARQSTPQLQDVITQAYTSIGSEIGATVIPAGVAWQTALREHKEIVLHDRDGSHPTLAGSFLAACVAYKALFEAPLRQLRVEIDGITPGDLRSLQSVADEVALKASARRPRKSGARKQRQSGDGTF